MVSLLSKHLRGVDQVNPPTKPYSSLRTTVLTKSESKALPFLAQIWIEFIAGIQPNDIEFQDLKGIIPDLF
jgi:hypothetical protein